ncbi:16S rRNA (guanine(966)-N(2))-methyltransferase RsmD [Pseudooceanicola sp. MF1-13]|uniref:16S rRNA (guanine(966)-N(2))-methyltransferase RsmD n=1 Tax=Pseudooceanicola sp. MF1-13 TaxID=3379095 RepID=UPI0038915FCC
MRIVGGSFRGRRLAALGKGDAGAHLRPTSDRVRESLFSMLEGGRFGNPIEGAVVLDLFAGTGALGLEALSRGAASVTFVDDGRVAQKLLSENITTLGVKDVTKVIRTSALRLPEATGSAGLVFLDPPYGKDLGAKALSTAKAQGWIADGALIVWEERGPQEAPDGFDLLEHKSYGDTVVTLLRG